MKIGIIFFEEKTPSKDALRCEGAELVSEVSVVGVNV